MTETFEGGENNQGTYRFYYWGPLLFQTKIKKEDVKKLKKIAAESTELWTDNLAGIIKKEYKIDSKKYTDVIRPYLKSYQHAYKAWYTLDLHKVETTAAWVNYMSKGESNPPHIHHNCHLSSVLFLDVPEKLKQEQKAWKGTGEGPAALTFFVANPQNFHTNSFAFKPEVGDFFIFPWNVTHSVSSFNSDVTRVSVAANFLLKDNNIFEDNMKVKDDIENKA